MADKEISVTTNPSTKQTVVASGNGNKPKPVQHALIPSHDSEVIKDALVILRGGQETPQRILELATKLKSELRFGYARRLLLRASQHKDTPLDQKLREKI